MHKIPQSINKVRTKDHRYRGQQGRYYDENRENDRKLWYLINVIEALRSCLNRHEYMNQQLLRV